MNVQPPVPQREWPSTRTVMRVCLAAAGTAAALAVLWQLRDVVKLIVLAVFLALVLGKPVELCARRLPRPAAIGVVYLGLAALLVGALAAVIPPIVTELGALGERLPRLLDDLAGSQTIRRLGLDRALDDTDAWTGRVGDLAGMLQDVTLTVGALALKALTVATMAAFMLYEAPRLSQAADQVLHRDRRDRAFRVAEQIYRTAGGYVAGVSLLAVCAGAMAYATLTLLGVPFALPLAALMTILSFVPLLGASIAGVTIALACLADSPAAAAIWLTAFFCYQQTENSVLAPLVYRRTVQVHPLLVIVSLLAGSALLGALGALLAIPAAAMIQIVVRDWWQHRERPLALPGGVAYPPSAGPGGQPTGDEPA